MDQHPCKDLHTILKKVHGLDNLYPHFSKFIEVNNKGISSEL